jgi:hypothetical protein
MEDFQTGSFILLSLVHMFAEDSASCFLVPSPSIVRDDLPTSLSDRQDDLSDGSIAARLPHSCPEMQHYATLPCPKEA